MASWPTEIKRWSNESPVESFTYAEWSVDEFIQSLRRFRGSLSDVRGSDLPHF